MKLFIMVLLSSVMALGMVGCGATIGEKFDPSYVQHIENGKTTKSEIRQNLGEPQGTETSGQNETWVYRYYKSPNLFEGWAISVGAKNLNPNEQRLTIKFEGDVVKEFLYEK